MGSDTRDCDGCDLDNEAGGNASDTTILMHLSADRKRAYGVSIPRDTLVDRPSCKATDGSRSDPATDVMWNEAFTVGGPTCTVQQFEAITDVFIDHIVVVNFAGFEDMVNAIDGVPVCIPEDIVDPAHGINIPAGTREIEGREALNYVRARYTLGDGSDISRIKRQQAFIAAMAKKVVSAGTLARVDRLVRFLNAATNSLTVDEDLENVVKIAEVGVGFQGIGLDNIQFLTAPIAYFPSDSENAGRVFFTPPAEEALVAARRRRAAARRSSRATRSSRRRPPGKGGGGVRRRRQAPVRARRRRRPSRTASARDRAPSAPERARPPGTGRAARARLAEVFGDVLPESTADDRRRRRTTATARPTTRGCGRRCRPTTAERAERVRGWGTRPRARPCPTCQQVADLLEQRDVVGRARLLLREELLLRPGVGHHDQEVDDGGDHEERDQRRQEHADRDAVGLVAREVGHAPGLADQVHDHADGRGDHGRERRGHDEGDGQLDQVAPQDEVLESGHGSSSPPSPGAPWCGRSVTLA